MNNSTTSNTIILIATSNEHKIQEISTLLPYSIPYTTPHELGITCNPQETENSFLENAMIKATAYYHELNRLSLSQSYVILAEDSGLCVEALDGAPGIHSARYGDTSDSGKQNKLVLEALGDTEHRDAYFTCCAVCMATPHDFLVSQASWMGSIVKEEPRGANGFGYDPIFYVDEFECTSAELSPEQKNVISHRAQALETLVPAIENKYYS